MDLDALLSRAPTPHRPGTPPGTVGSADVPSFAQWLSAADDDAAAPRANAAAGRPNRPAAPDPSSTRAPRDDDRAAAAERDGEGADTPAGDEGVAHSRSADHARSQARAQARARAAAQAVERSRADAQARARAAEAKADGAAPPPAVAERAAEGVDPGRAEPGRAGRTGATEGGVAAPNGAAPATASVAVDPLRAAASGAGPAAVAEGDAEPGRAGGIPDPAALAAPADLASAEGLPGWPGAAAGAGPGAMRSGAALLPGSGPQGPAPIGARAHADGAQTHPGAAGGRQAVDLPPASAATASAVSAEPVEALRTFGERSRAATEAVTAPAATAAFALALTVASGYDRAAPAGETAPLPTYPVTVPVLDARFGDAFAERVTWMVREGLQGAELTLNPQELGPIRIEIALDGDAATMTVVATQAETRGAIEQALPRLREMLSSQGLQLGGAMIDAGAGRDARDDGARGRPARPDGRGPLISGLEAAGPAGIGLALPTAGGARAGRIDLFA
jgi:flagellar hook-length control protein FliK